MAKKINKIKKQKIRRKEIYNNMSSAFDEAEISWTAPEDVNHERGIIWKVSAGLFVILSVVFGYILGAWTFSLAIIAFALVYYLIYMNKKPGIVKIKISRVGIKVGNRKYPFSRIKAFWIIYEPPFTKTLNIRVSGDILYEITIQLGDKSPAPVREYLIKKVPEIKGKEENLSDIFLKVFKI